MIKVTYADGRVERYSSRVDMAASLGINAHTVYAWCTGANKGYKRFGIVSLETEVPEEVEAVTMETIHQDLLRIERLLERKNTIF